MVGNRRNQLFLLALGIFVFVLTLLLTKQQGEELPLDKEAMPVSEKILLPPPPTFEKVWKWEKDLPQHNLQLPFPEGKTGRYVKFTNQARRLGWNNCLNEMCVGP